MKKLLYLLLILTQAAIAQTGFERGNELYRQGKYPEAIAAYEDILSNQMESAEVYFNLGNAHFKMNRVAPAIYNYEKALLLKPGDDDIITNLKFARKMTVDESGTQRESESIFGVLNYEIWGWLAISFSCLLVLCFAGYYLTSKVILKRAGFGGMAVATVLMITCLIAAFSVRSTLNEERPAIVFSATASVKSEPVTGSAEAFALHEGTKVYVLENLDNWKKIELSGNREGWIEASAIKELK